MQNGREKTELLMDILAAAGRRKDEKADGNPQYGLTLIFVETKRSADILEAALIDNGFPATTIHGDRSQPERMAALASFKAGQTPFLVATDVASRGLDIPHVEHVVNYDLPSDVDTYVHRIGRTGRAGRSGEATALVNKYEDTRIASNLVPLLRDAGQTIPEELEMMANGGGWGGGGGKGAARGGSGWGGGGYGGGGGGGGGYGGGAAYGSGQGAGGARGAPTKDVRQGNTKAAPAAAAPNAKWLWDAAPKGGAGGSGEDAWDD